MSSDSTQHVVVEHLDPGYMIPLRGTTLDGSPLRPGVNVDKVDNANGMAAAQPLGWVRTAEDRLVVEYALWRHARGEEFGAQRTWMSHFGKHNLEGWYVVLANALVAS